MITCRLFVSDDTKASGNIAKHGVSFISVATVFLDEAAVEVDAFRPADDEVRLKILGTIEGRVFTVVFTMRDEMIRIISARRSNAKESRAYGAVHSRS